METKKCTKCGEEKELFAFSKNKSKKGGYNSICKACSHLWYKSNFERYRIKAKAYRDINNVLIAEKAKKFRKENSEYVNLKEREYYKNNTEKVKAKNKKSREKNLNKVKVRAHNYYKDHSEEIKERSRLWRKNNYGKRQEWLHNNKDKILISSKKSYHKRSAKLTDNYIANYYFKTKLDNIPKELIELKREQIKLLRECNKYQNQM